VINDLAIAARSAGAANILAVATNKAYLVVEAARHYAAARDA